LTFAQELPKGVNPGKGIAVLHSSGKSDVLNAELAISKGSKSVYIISQNPEEAWSRFKAQFHFVQAAGGIVVKADKSILFIFRKGKWDLPKGKVEDGEDIMEGAIREVEEECSISQLNVHSKLCDTWHTYVQDGDPVLKCTAWYLMHYEGDEVPIPQALEGITEVRWVSEKDLSQVSANTYPSVLEVLFFCVARILRDSNSF